MCAVVLRNGSNGLPRSKVSLLSQRSSRVLPVLRVGSSGVWLSNELLISVVRFNGSFQ